MEYLWCFVIMYSTKHTPAGRYDLLESHAYLSIFSVINPHTSTHTQCWENGLMPCWSGTCVTIVKYVYMFKCKIVFTLLFYMYTMHKFVCIYIYIICNFVYVVYRAAHPKYKYKDQVRSPRVCRSTSAYMSRGIYTRIITKKVCLMPRYEENHYIYTTDSLIPKDSELWHLYCVVLDATEESKPLHLLFAYTSDCFMLDWSICTLLNANKCDAEFHETKTYVLLIVWLSSDARLQHLYFHQCQKKVCCGIYTLLNGNNNNFWCK